MVDVHLCFANIAFHRESLTFSVRAGGLAGLHDSTPPGIHRRTVLPVPVAAWTHDENLALRQQLSTVLQKRRPRIGLVDRAFWVMLRRVWGRR